MAKEIISLFSTEMTSTWYLFDKTVSKSPRGKLLGFPMRMGKGENMLKSANVAQVNTNEQIPKPQSHATEDTGSSKE